MKDNGNRKGKKEEGPVGSGICKKGYHFKEMRYL